MSNLHRTKNDAKLVTRAWLLVQVNIEDGASVVAFSNKFRLSDFITKMSFYVLCVALIISQTLLLRFN